ncbi:MAG: D-alanine--D-alanine ligase [Chlamydiae bacterium]|nr:D-alanine--D-alanine ligase [Chlamydiota bacterium]
MRVGLTYNLKKRDQDPADEHGAEWDTPETIQAIVHALSRQHKVVPLIADHAVFSQLRKNELDIVFNIAEGDKGPNRESHIPSFLEFLDIPYTGSDPFTLSACLNKARTKEILAFYGIPTPSFQVVREASSLRWQGSFPVLVKPLWEGSSMGIHDASWVDNRASLHQKVEDILDQYRQPVIIEEVLKGREFTVALIGNRDALSVLPVVEVRLDVLPPQARPIYSYEAKWIWDTPDRPLGIFECPARMDPLLEENVIKISKSAFNALGCRDWCRIDIRLDRKGNPHILELNPLPGILPDPLQNSCFPKAARVAGISYDDMILKILNVALERYETSSSEYKVGSQK